MKAIMKRYVVKGLILMKEESKEEKDQTKENWMSKKVLIILLMSVEGAVGGRGNRITK